MNKTNATKEKRKGFHPALVISTIAVVIFVLWFCPKALMNARIEQTENRAVRILTNKEFLPETTNLKTNGKVKLTPKKEYTDYLFFKTGDSHELVFAVPEYYNKTAINTYCLKDGKIYKKNLNKISLTNKTPKFDNTWETL